MLFSKQVIVPVCDHFFDGTPENRPLLEQIYQSFPECLFIEYPFIPEKMPQKVWKKINKAKFWHSVSRLVGFHYLNSDSQFVLFLDADEVPDGKRFSAWLDNSDYKQHIAMKLANYWYFREPSFQSLSLEDTIVLAQKRALQSEILLKQEERDAIYHLVPGPKKRGVTDSEGEPMFHHYSWVRTKEEMLKKVQSWGHKHDRDWVSLVHEEFSRPFSGTDFVHGYSFKEVTPFAKCQAAFEGKKAPNVVKISPKELLKKIRKRNFWNFLDFLGAFSR